MTNFTGTASVACLYACVASENQAQGCVRLGNPELDLKIGKFWIANRTRHPKMDFVPDSINSFSNLHFN